MQCLRTIKQKNEDDSGRSGEFWHPTKSSRAVFLAHAGLDQGGQIRLYIYTMGIMMAKGTAS